MNKVSNDWSLGCVKPRDAMPGTGVRTLTQGQEGEPRYITSHFTHSQYNHTLTLSHSYTVTHSHYCHTLTLSHCRTSHCTVTHSHCQLSHTHTVTHHTVTHHTVTHHTVTHSHCHTTVTFLQCYTLSHFLGKGGVGLMHVFCFSFRSHFT